VPNKKTDGSQFSKQKNGNKKREGQTERGCSMRATLLKTTKQPSVYGGSFYYFFFKGEDGEHYRSCISPKCRNFGRWQPFIHKEDIVLNGLMKKTEHLIDADSFPTEER